MIALRARGSWGVLPLVLAITLLAAPACGRRSSIPGSISDAEFWHLSETLSEPPGSFDLSDNLVSNEPQVADNARWLRTSGGVYIGVGPEQNFSYIVKARPSMAFVVDIRQENRSLHLMYKALFELARDRPEFVSRLFSRPRPPSTASSASVTEIFRAISLIPPSSVLLAETMGLIRERLTAAHHLPLSSTDLAWIEHSLRAFHDGGPEIHFWTAGPADPASVRPPYRALMTAADLTGQQRSFLANEDAFQFVKDLQSRNLVVPVVGDFGGIGALRRVGDYIRARGDVVLAFYGSNVAVYLTNDKMRAFCRNLAALPATPETAFIERDGVRALSARLASCAR